VTQHVALFGTNQITGTVQQRLLGQNIECNPSVAGKEEKNIQKGILNFGAMANKPSRQR